MLLWTQNLNNLVSLSVKKSASVFEQLITNSASTVIILFYNNLILIIGWSPESEYQHEYIAKKGDYYHRSDTNEKDPSVFLRSSQFMLGNTPVNYQTSTQAQSESIPKDGKYHNNRLTEETKQRLRKSQFTLGTSTKSLPSAHLFVLN